MALWDLHYIRRLDDMGFVDALYGRQGSNDGGQAGHDHPHRHSHGHAHDHGHGEPAAAATATMAGLEGIVSTACDDEDCGAKH
jgi:hypothetical protein